MRKFSLILFLLIFAANSFSQDIKKETKRLPNYTETYHVLKNNKKVRHGKYFMLSYGDTLQSGYYTNNIKSGNWRYYKGKDLEFMYNFDTKRIVTDTLGKERPALYSEGFSFFKTSNTALLRYPLKSAEAGHSGKVIISFKVGADGSVNDFEVYEGCGDIALNEEALRVVKETAQQASWYPAINVKGEKVLSTITKDVIFQIL